MGIRVKGQAILAFERTLIEMHGRGAMTPLRSDLLPDMLTALESREVLAMGWYPMEWFASLHGAAQKAYGPGVSREIGRLATRHDVTTLYRFILRFVSPATLMGQMKRIFGMVCDSGGVLVEENREGSARVRFVGCAGANRGTWEDMLGSIETLLELCGGREASARVISGGADGDATMSCLLTWK
jgi:hypothetical protein